MASPITFTEAVYDPGHNWCWFYIRADRIVAKFRLHMEEDDCWDMFKALDGPNLFPHLNAHMTFRYGSSEKRDTPKRKPEVISEVPAVFSWLEELLTKPNRTSFSESWCAYHGVVFSEVA